MESFSSITKSIISPLPKCLWPPNIAAWRLTVKVFHQCITWPWVHILTRFVFLNPGPQFLVNDSVTNDYDIICLTETFLDSLIENDDDRISIPGYNLLRTDHPSNAKRGFVSSYYKDHLPVIKRNDLCQLHECLVTELRIGKKNVSLHACIDPLAKHPRNLRISVQTLTYSCQILMISTQHVLL